MSEFHNRQAVQLEDDTLRLSVTPEGGHIAELLLKKTGISPLWIPPWPTIEPSRYNGQQYPEYGQNSESKLLSGIMGHNLCLDIFGPPSEEEFRSGITVHGEGSVARYDIEVQPSQLTARVHLPLAQLDFQRQLRLHGGVVEITERVENNLALDRPIAWTQHVTLGEPFVERGVTRLDMPVEKSVTYPDDFGAAQLYKPNASFTWPEVPAKDGGTLDMTTYPAHAGSSALTGHLVVPERNIGFFKAWNPKLNTAVVYAWQRRDFPWICLWEENEGRTNSPWNKRTTTWGVEFGASPYAESRRRMIDRGTLFGTPTFRWLPASSELEVRYIAAVKECRTEQEFKTLHEGIIELLPSA